MSSKLEIGDLVKFKNNHLVILEFLTLEGRDNYPSIKIIKVIEYPNSTIELYEIKDNKVKDKVDWYNVSHYQTLSEGFIREFQNKVDWYNVSYYQTLSEGFIREFQTKVHWNWISQNKNISNEVKTKFKKKGKF
jgi:hypothetical protein